MSKSINSIAAPLDLTQSAERINVAQPGFALKYQTIGLYYGFKSVESLHWNVMLKVFDLHFWFVLIGFSFLIISLLAWSGFECSLQELVLAKIAVVKALFCQSFDQQVFCKVDTYFICRMLQVSVIE